MDARPQRPLRTLRIHDENAPPAVAPGKTIHHRNKSTPALSMLGQPAAAKPAASRMVFADLSNTSRSVQPAQDDLAVGGKRENIGTKGGVSLSAQDIIKPAALLRPAQRPLAAVTQKENAVPVSSTSTSGLTKSIAKTNTEQPVKAQKALTKKATTIFKEPKEPLQPAEAKPTAPNVAPLQQSHAHNVKAAPQLSRQGAVDRSLREFLDNAIGDPLPKSAPAPSQREEVVLPALRHITALVPLPAPAEAPLPEPYHDVQSSTESTGSRDEVNDDSAGADFVEALEHQAQALEAATRESMPPPEVEEYWEEDDEEYYEAEGYTTARSIRSRSDNTTTGGLTVLFNVKYTAHVERELQVAREFVEANKSPEELEDEAWDTSMVAEYGDEIFEYMHSLEERMRPNPYYMDNQTEIQWSMRSVLMDWLVQVHLRFNLLPETLFLSVNYIDRFLSCKVVSLGKLQLVGATALFVASKFEEINCPSVQEIVYMVDSSYTVDEILKAERFMLSMLSFEMGWPGPMSFLRRISKADDYDLETRTLAKYFLEVSLMDERFVSCTPSLIAAASQCLARFMLRKGDWSFAHMHYSQYTYAQLHPTVATLVQCCRQPQKHHNAVFDKYCEKRFKRAACFVENEIRRGFQLPSVSRESSLYSFSVRRK